MEKNYPKDEFTRKREARQRKLRKRRLKVFFSLFLILLLIIGIVLSLTVLFPIKKITAKGSRLYTEAQIIENCDIEIGDNLLVASEEKAINSLRTKLPFVETVEFERSLPDTLIITVTEAKEYVCYNINGKYFTVSKDDWVLATYQEKPKNLTEIIAKGVKCNLGTKIEFDNKDINQLRNLTYNTLCEYGLSIDSLKIESTSKIEAEIDGRFTVKFGSSKDFEKKVKHLKSMIKKIGEGKGGTIDLSMWNSQNTQGIFVQSATK